ncbi:ferric reductase [Malaciobacter molluscorum LMG 25693]|uniref:Ferric reductase n=1 Tax=Malaciobacter molluscorum LMG 25693 TaxID=870501 RepID=A0A2G1DJC4_9BACT|nr:ferric reductase-like transmembrane domain-containing protein [Malaciobacter molluscorum]AXX91596.1 periplasmic DMSO/TMAO reductase YedYZ, heme-binding membrane subunit [Malaciobacter molluscorum LMG 25693]PHO18609.1 ferric reductase [Malaciobacter molluscorum LMG 25693]
MRIFLFVVFLTPFFIALYSLFITQNVIDPIKYIYTFSGVVATVILFFTIIISLMKRFINLMKYRRMIGLFGFFYACLHIINFVVLDAQFDVDFIINNLIKKPFIYLGAMAFFILVFLALTSTKRLFRKYNKYHKTLYLSLVLITIHFILAQKSLDIYQIFYIFIIGVISIFKLIQIKNLFNRN